MKEIKSLKNKIVKRFGGPGSGPNEGDTRGSYNTQKDQIERWAKGKLIDGLLKSPTRRFDKAKFKLELEKMTVAEIKEKYKDTLLGYGILEHEGRPT